MSTRAIAATDVDWGGVLVVIGGGGGSGTLAEQFACVCSFSLSAREIFSHTVWDDCVMEEIGDEL